MDGFDWLLSGILTAIPECRNDAWMVLISSNNSVLEPDWNLPNDDIVTIWLDSLSVDFPNGGSRGLFWLRFLRIDSSEPAPGECDFSADSPVRSAGCTRGV